MLHVILPWLTQNGVIRVQRRSDCQSLITRSRLNPRVAEWRAVKKLAVRNAVESASTRHSKFFHRHTFMQLIQQMEESIFKALLHGTRQIHLASRDFAVWLPRRTEVFHHLVRKVTR